MKSRKRVLVWGLPLIWATLLGGNAWARQAQPVPVPEEPSTVPQIDLDGVAATTLGTGPAGQPDVPGGIDFSDSALFVGAAQRMYDGSAVGSFGLGALTTEGGGVFLDQGFADFQGQHLEALIGRTDNRTAHLVDFPTLRGDDLVTLTNPLDPFSNGQDPEEHRYADVASVTFNQGLAYFEDLHVQHLIDSAGASQAVNSLGATFEYLGPPGLEALEPFPSWGAGYEYLPAGGSLPGGLHELYAGGVMNLDRSITDRWDLRAQDILTLGSSLSGFRDLTDTFQANSDALAVALRYLHSPFGRPGYQLALTSGVRTYFEVPDALSLGWALTGVKRLGDGFDLVAQYQGQWRAPGLAQVQSAGLPYVQTLQVGFVFDFQATFNQQLAPRRSLLNEEHQYIPE